MSDDHVSVFIQQVASASVAKAPESFEALIDVPVQIMAQADLADVQLSADVLVPMADSFQVESHHTSAHYGMIMFETFCFELADLIFRKMEASHAWAPLGHKGSKEETSPL